MHVPNFELNGSFLKRAAPLMALILVGSVLSTDAVPVRAPNALAGVPVASLSVPPLSASAASGAMAEAAAPPPPIGVLPAAPPAAPPPSSSPVPTPAKASLGPLEFISQTLNNCGPASIAEVLHYWGVDRTQDQVQAAVRSNDPYGMTPAEVPDYIHSLGLGLMLSSGGSQPLVKALLANGFPVIVNQMVSVSDPTFHYRPIDAFDDGAQLFASSDPYLGAQHAITYADFDQIWAATGNQFMVVYPPQKEGLLNAVVGAIGWTPSSIAFAERSVLPALKAVPPVTSASLSGKSGGGDWYSGPVTVKLQAADDGGAGVAMTTYQVDGGAAQRYAAPFTVSGDGRHEVTFSSADYAGNVEQSKKASFGISQKPPGLVITGVKDGAAYTLGGVPSPAVAVHGGVAPYQTATHLSQPVDAVGAVTYSATAKDAAGAGASASATFTISYRVCAFYDPKYGFHVGDTVGLAIQLCDVNGTNASSQQLPVVAVSVSNGGPGVALNQPFVWDPALPGGGYIFNLNTRGYAPGSYTLNLSAAGDPVPHQLAFELQGFAPAANTAK